MTSAPQEPKPTAGVAHVLRVGTGVVGSLKLAVVLLVVSAVILAATTIIEARKGTEYAQWYVYHSLWFIVLLALLSANILAATLHRFPWKRRHIGFLLAHLGVLVLLGGSLQTYLGGIEGQLPFAEQDKAEEIFIPDRSLLKVVLHGEGDPATTEFAFSPGPFDWPEGKTLDFGQAEGIGLEVLRFFAHARQEVTWVADESGLGGPALEFALNGPGGKTISQQWLAGSQLSDGVEIGPARFELFTTAAEAMIGDFLDPPLAESGPSGVVSMSLGDQVARVDVRENVGKRVPLGDTGVAVEIVEYLPNAVLGAGDRLVSKGTEPRNPMVDLLAFLPGRDEPVRQLAFALYPALNFDRAHGRACPVKFWYYHPAVSARPGVQFLQGPDGTLSCRVGAGGKYVSKGEVGPGDQIETWVGFRVSLLNHVPHARQQVEFRPVSRSEDPKGRLEAAALVQLSLGEETEQVWLQRNGDRRIIQIPEGMLVLSLQFDQLPLGFSLKLLDFEHGLNPGGVGDASFASRVQLVDPAREIDEERRISMNQPLVHDKFTFYQSRFEELSDGTHVSILSVSHDPGRLLKYLGSLMICVGTFVTFYLRKRSSGEGLSSVSKKRRHCDPQGAAEDPGAD